MSYNSPPNEISLYFHIPFCTRKCDYCHFFVLPDKEIWKDQLLRSFELELLATSDKLKDKKIVSLYFGGGTPSLFGPERIAKVLNMISYGEDTEITLEANPENISYDMMHGYAQAGINRVSIGIQSLDDSLLSTLTRSHGAQKAMEAVYATSEAGIDNISIDLMYDLPHQTLSQWCGTLARAVTLPITHLSLYNLTLEPHTVFFKKKDLLQKHIPNEETSLQMYEEATRTLNQNKLNQYEISAFAKDNYYSRHNLGYWTGRQFLGLGPSAFSYWGGRRYRNVANLNRYSEALEKQQSPIDFEEELDADAKLRELLTIRLRLLCGVNLCELGSIPEETKKVFRKLEEEGLLELRDEHVQLTKKGILFYDTIAEELI